MKTRLLTFLIAIIPFLCVNAQWSNYTENFDTWANFQGDSPAAYGPQSYINGGAPENDIFSSNNARIMYNAGCLSAPYHWNLYLSISPVYFRYQTRATVNSFHFFINRSNLAEDPIVVIRYSTNSGDSWTEIQTLNNSWFTGSIYKEYNYTFPTPVYPEFGKELIIDVYKTYGTYVNIDDFTCNHAPACIWNGSNDNGWNKESNWTGEIPGQYSNVTIPADAVNFPTIDEPAECFNLYMTTGASLINNSSFTVHGQTYIFREISGANQYHYISSPVINPNIGDIFPADQYDNIWLRRYDEPGSSWMNMYIPSVMETGNGYSFFMDEPATTITFSGSLNNANVSPQLSYAGNSGDSDYDNWNLLGNPFTSALNWDLGTWNRSGLNGSVYVWDENSGNYVSWNGSSGGLTDGLIATNQGFFVKVENESSPSITLPLNARVHTADGFLKTRVNPSLELLVQNSVNSFFDKTFIESNPVAMNGFDTQCDAYKLDGNADAPSLSSMAGGKRLSVNSLSQIDNNLTVPVYLKPGVEGDFIITASGIENFTGITGLMLQDLITGVTTDLKSEASYAFYASPGDNEHRFNLVFGTLGVEDANMLNAGMYSNNKNINIRVSENFNGRVIISNIMGQQLMKSGLSGGSLHTIQTGLPTGMYLVTVSDETGSLTRKVYIH